MSRRRVACAALFLLLASCTSGGGGDRASSPPQPWRGGTLRIADVNSRYFLDPTRSASVASTSAELLRCCLARTLISYEGRPVEEGGSQPRPDLATSLPEVSADGLTWTFRMKPGLPWAPPLQDREIVASDVVRALERTADPAMGSMYTAAYSVIEGFDAVLRRDAPTISGLEVPDPFTLVVRVTEPTGHLPYLFSLPSTAPIPKGAADGHRNLGRFLVSSGPYMFDGSEAMDLSLPPREQPPPIGYAWETFTFVRNPSWDPATDPLRPAYVDRIVIENHAGEGEFFDLDFFYALQAKLARQVDAGVVDLTLATLQSADQVRRYLEDPALRLRLLTGSPNEVAVAAFNLAVRPFDDVHVRRAVSLALDEERVVEQLGRGPDWMGAKAATHLAPDGTEGLLLSSYLPSWDAGRVPDPVGARAEMRRSRYDDDGDGRCDGPACRRVLVLVEPSEEDLYDPPPSRIVSDAFATIGIDPRFELLEYGPLFETIGTPGGRWGIHLCVFCAGWVADWPSASNVFTLLYDGSAITEEGNLNVSLMGATPAQLRRWGYAVDRVPSVDRRIDACLWLKGSAQSGCWASLDQYLMEEVVPAIPLFVGVIAIPLSERVAHASFDQFVGLPALDRIALVPGST